MPLISKEFKVGVQSMPANDLQKLVLKLARSNKEVYDIINITYQGNEEARQDFFQERVAAINGHLYGYSLKGPIQRSIAKAMGNAVKEVSYYVKITGDKIGEAELLNYLINEVITHHSDDLGTCWTVFDSKLGVTTKRLLNLVTKKLHEDYLLNYKDDINNYLNILHQRSNHIDLIYGLPECI
jgi:hypothetical protein